MTQPPAPGTPPGQAPSSAPPDAPGAEATRPPVGAADASAGTAPASPADAGSIAATAGAAVAGKPRASRWPHGLGLLAWIGLVLALPLALGWWAWHDPRTLPWALSLVPGLKAEGVRGSLAERRLAIDRLDWTLPGQLARVQARGLAVDGVWLGQAPHDGAWLALGWRALSIDELKVDKPPSGRPPPTDLQLPLVLRDAPVQIGRLQWNELPAAGPVQARVWLGDDGGRLHRVEGLQARLPQADIDGRLQIGTRAPLPLQATLNARSRPMPAHPELPPWQGSARAEGPLTRLALQAQLQSQLALRGAGAPAAATARSTAPSTPQTTLQASATVSPFADWPLAELRLRSRGLDLAALLPQGPRTALDVQADIDTRGIDQPIGVDAVLTNRLPGRWDQGRLPLQQARILLRGERAHTDRLGIERFELQLADAVGSSAGQLSGRGQWLRDAATLTLQFTGLLPARLHAAAPAITVSGPLTLQLGGLPWDGKPAAWRLQWQGSLDGRLLDGLGAAVALRSQGEASASQLLVREAELRSGEASASFSLQAEADTGAAGRGLAGPWRLRTQGRLARFDPLPWWRGTADAAGNAWRRGPHRIDGDWTADLRWPGTAVPAIAPTTAAAAASSAATSTVSRGTPATRASPTTARTPTLAQALDRLQGDATLRLADSRLAGLPVAADWQLQLLPNRQGLRGWATVAGNRLDVDGHHDTRPGGRDDQWQLALDLPAPAALAPLRPLLQGVDAETMAALAPWWPRAGRAQAQARLAGRWPALRTEGQLTAAGLVMDQATLGQVQLAWLLAEQADAPLRVDLQASGLRQGEAALDKLSLQVSGTQRQHRLDLAADSGLRPPALLETWLGAAGNGTQLRAAGQGSLERLADGRQHWRLRELALSAGARNPPAGSRPWLSAEGISAQLQASAAGGLLEASLAPGRLQLPHTALRWREVRWQAGGGTGGAASRLSVSGDLEPIDVAPLLARLQPAIGWGGNLMLGGRIELQAAQSLTADMVLERTGGDLLLIDDLGATQALGITDLRLALTGRDGVWQFAQGLAGRSLGEMAGAVVVRNAPGQRWPSAASAMEGVLDARVNSLAIWGTWVPPGWRLGGALHTTAQIGGRLGAPELRGELRGSQLTVRNLLQGVGLTDGELAVQLEGDRAQITRGVFRGGDGQLTLQGDATLGARPALNLQVQADRFRLLGRVDRRIITSGQARVLLDANRLRVDGQLAIDEGQIDISRSDAPTLDSDVQVHRGGTARPIDRVAEAPAPPPGPAARQAQVQLALRLGDKLRLRGRGIDTNLRGDLTVSSQGGRLTLNGTVLGDGGHYAAYGQKLDITRGELVFTGPADNPRLDVRATRPNLDVVVGVAITGSALNPRVRLFSEPELAEYDKLSWLVLGRSPDGLGRADTALLQRAAAALLTDDGKAPTDELIQALGLTDFSVRQTEGSVRDTVVTLGRQLSQRWYLGYERSVNATTGTWQLVYRAAQRFTLRAQSGTDNAVDAIWSWRW